MLLWLFDLALGLLIVTLLDELWRTSAVGLLAVVCIWLPVTYAMLVDSIPPSEEDLVPYRD